MAKKFSLPFEAADYLFAPTELPSPATDLDTFLQECNQRVGRLICEAWSKTALPDRTALVSCLTTSPVHEVGFKNPWILKRSELNSSHRLRLIGAFAHTTYYLQKERASSHARVREHGDPSRSTVIVFTKRKPRRPWPSCTAHILHFGFQNARWGEPSNFRDCEQLAANRDFDRSSQLGNFKTTFEAFDAHEFIAEAEKEQISSITENKEAPTDWDGFPTAAAHADCPERVNGLFDNIKADRSYCDRVSTLLECGAIVLCLPQSFSFHKNGNSRLLRDPNVILDSGLTVLLSGDQSPSDTDIKQILAVAHNVSLFVASTYGLASALARHEVSVTTGLIAESVDHELKNAAANVSAILEMMIGTPMSKEVHADIRARLDTAKTALAALTATSTSKSGESVADDFSAVVKTFNAYSDFKVTVGIREQVQLSKARLPSAFRLLLSELIRNAYKSNPVSRHIANARIATATIEIGNKVLSITVTNPTDADATIDLQSDANVGHGLGLVARLCKELHATIEAEIENSAARVIVKLPTHKYDNP